MPTQTLVLANCFRFLRERVLYCRITGLSTIKRGIKNGYIILTFLEWRCSCLAGVEAESELESESIYSGRIRSRNWSRLKSVDSAALKLTVAASFTLMVRGPPPAVRASSIIVSVDVTQCLYKVGRGVVVGSCWGLSSPVIGGCEVPADYHYEWPVLTSWVLDIIVSRARIVSPHPTAIDGTDMINKCCRLLIDT